MAAALSTSASGQVPAPALPKADLVLFDGQIYLPDGHWATGIAIAKDAIIAVGDDATVKAYATPSAKVIDLKQQTVLPGLRDMHIHPLSGGLGLNQCSLVYGSSPDRIKQQVAACATSKKPGEWIVGHGWANSVFQGKTQDHTLLDDAAPQNPVTLTDETGHSTWANAMAMKLAGVTRSTPNPLNGIIEHDAAGEPNGLFREAGADLIRRVVPAASAAENLEAMKHAYDHILSVGITHIRDAVATQTSLAAQTVLSDQGYPSPKVEACIRWAYNTTGVDQPFEALYAIKSTFRRRNIKPDCVKFILDGVPGDGQTAAMIDAYPHPLSEEREFGLLTIPPDVLKTMMIRFDKDGMSTLSHCTGDRCARAAIDAIDAARQANGFSGRIHQIGHSNFTTATDLKRTRGLGISSEFSAYLYYWNAQTRTYLNAVGPDRFQRYKPVRETLDDGANAIEGSDWPISETANPWIAMETLVTRLPPGQPSGEKLAPKEAITLKEAVDMYTVNAARQFGDAYESGQIKPGYLADLVVIDRNIFQVLITEVHNTKVLMTFIDGQIVYQAK